MLVFSPPCACGRTNASYWTAVDRGRNLVSAAGTNAWDNSSLQWNESYLLQKMPPLGMAAVIDSLLLEPPQPAANL